MKVVYLNINGALIVIVNIVDRMYYVHEENLSCIKCM